MQNPVKTSQSKKSNLSDRYITCLSWTKTNEKTKTKLKIKGDVPSIVPERGKRKGKGKKN